MTDHTTDVITDQWISRVKLALSLVIIKQKPGSQTGEEYARFLAQKLRRYQQDLVATNRALKEENLQLCQKLIQHQLATDGDSGFCSGQELFNNDISTNLENSNSSCFQDSLGFFQALISLKSHVKSRLGHCDPLNLNEMLCRSLNCVFRYLLGKSALSLPADILNDTAATLVEVCETSWAKDISDSVHITCMEFTNEMLQNMHLVDVWMQEHYTRLICYLGKSCHLWVKLCDRLVKEVQTFGSGAAEKGAVDPMQFQAIYGSLNALEILWNSCPEHVPSTLPITAWASALESSVRNVWEHLPLFHIYVSFLQTRLKHLLRVKQVNSLDKNYFTNENEEHCDS